MASFEFLFSRVKCTVQIGGEGGNDLGGQAGMGTKKWAIKDAASTSTVLSTVVDFG